jgi:hypothetical protein
MSRAVVSHNLSSAPRGRTRAVVPPLGSAPLWPLECSAHGAPLAARHSTLCSARRPVGRFGAAGGGLGARALDAPLASLGARRPARPWLGGWQLAVEPWSVESEERQHLAAASGLGGYG